MGKSFLKQKNGPEDFYKLENINPEIHNAMDKMSDKAKGIAEKIKNRQKFIDGQPDLEWEKYFEEKTASNREIKNIEQELNDIKAEIEKLKKAENSILEKMSELMDFYAALADNFDDVNSDMAVHADAQSVKAEMSGQNKITADVYSSFLDYAETAVDRAWAIEKKIDDKIMELKQEKIRLRIMKEENSSSEEIAEREKTANNIYKDIMILIQKITSLDGEIIRYINKAREERKLLENFNPKIEQ